MSGIHTKRYNETIIQMLNTMETIMKRKGEHFRARAYSKAKQSIIMYPDDITKGEDVKHLKGVGATIVKKINEFIETGTLNAIEKEKENPIHIFTNVYGIGPKKAEELVHTHNIKTIEELREKQDELLNDNQKIGLKYYEDIMERIPRKEIDKFKKRISTIFKRVKNPESSFEIVGSYRRGAEDSGDIDIIITDPHNDVIVFDMFLNELYKGGFITHFLSRGEKKSLVIGKLPDTKTLKYKHRRIDFLFSPIDEYAFSTLYFTGSAAFNTAMRGVALKRKMTMNEHGLYSMEDKMKGDIIDIAFKTEQDIFAYLNMVYKEPHERIDGRSVEIITPESITISSKQISKHKISLPKSETVNKKVESKASKATKAPKASKVKKTNKKIKITGPAKKTKTQIRKLLTEFIGKGLSFIETLPQKDIEHMLRYANEDYYNNKGKVLLSDEQYDILKEYIERKYPDSIVLLEIGAPIAKEDKVKLPYFMGSMDKIKPDTGNLQKWKSTYTHQNVLSVKLDGVSGLYTTEFATESAPDKKPKLYTRGDGTYGQDITHILHYMKLPVLENVTVRGEFIVKKDLFEKELSGTFANPRNFVSGIINAKKGKESYYKYIDFVAYEVITPELKPSEQFQFLKDSGFLVAKNETISQAQLNNEILSDRLVDWRTNYVYEIDGVIVTDDHIYPRKDGNPKQSFAFKMVLSDQVAEAKVVDVLWEPSKDGYLKPRVRIEPVKLVGVTIEYATAFNAKFVCDHKIGVGTIIRLIRSGDVIPHIQEVISSSTEAKMPDVEYSWNDTKIDIIIKDLEKNATVQKKRIALFMKHMGIENIGDGVVKKLMNASYDTLEKIVKMEKEDFLKVDGIKDKMATKLLNNIQTRLRDASVVEYMSASNIFGRGFGEKKFQALLDDYSDILVTDDTKSIMLDKIIRIDGFSKKTAERVIEHIESFKAFMRTIHQEEKLKIQKSTMKMTKSHPLFGVKVVMTGFRDKELEASIKSFGGIVSGAVSKNIKHVVVKSMDEDTGKADKGRELGILITLDDFKKKYSL